MNITTAIQKLEEFKAEHGDVNIIYWENSGRHYTCMDIRLYLDINDKKHCSIVKGE